MKKITSSFIAVIMVAMFASVAFAGPVDWVMNKLGYTPTAVYETQIVQTQKALEAAKVANAAAKASQETAKQLASTAEFQSSVISYGGIALILLGGFGYIRRKKIAHTILDRTTVVPARPAEPEAHFEEKGTIRL